MIRHLRKFITIQSLLLTGVYCTTDTAMARTLTIFNWESLPKTATPELAFAVGDPLLGNLVCPAITRLSLQTNKQQLILLEQLTEKVGSKNTHEWLLQLKPNLHWWSGEAVQAKDLVKFIETYLSREIRRQSLGLWTIPPFVAEAIDAHTIKVVWDSKPVFGPYVFSSWPLLREVKGPVVGYECVGDFAPSVASDHRVTQFTRAKKSNRKSEFTDIVLLSNSATPSGTSWLDFRFPSSTTSHPSDRPSDRPANCDSVDAPILSLITWNPQGAHTQKPKIRQLFTQLTPRGELLRAGAAYLGDLVSGPLPRQHPGYNRAMLVRAFDIEKTTRELDAAGYKRKTANGARQDPNGKNLTIKLLTQSPAPGLIEKVLKDTFTAIGIDTTISSNPADFPNVDGVIAGIRLPWPGVSLLSALHSKASAAEPFWPLGDKQLDQLMEQYALSLTTTRPDFGVLRKLHARLFALEPFTLLVQHKLCMQAAPGLKINAKAANINDPDWLVKSLGNKL